MAGECERYLAWIRTLPCTMQPCPNPSRAHHAITGTLDGKKPGAKQKSDDTQAFPLCDAHHTDIHSLTSGPFKGWTRARLEKFEGRQIVVCQQAYARKFGERPWERDEESALPRILKRLPPVPVDPEPENAVVINLAELREQRGFVAPVLTVWANDDASYLSLHEDTERPLTAEQVDGIIAKLMRRTRGAF